MATDIVLKDRNGQDVTYTGIETVTFDTPVEGVQTTFTHGKVVDGVTIVLDFSEGDQAISVPEGALVKQATIVKPAELVPENIAKDVDICGVVGTHKGGDFFITYMSDDGSETLYVKPVMYGDTCCDAIALGLFDTPTKEATETEEYLFQGWATSIGGEVDSTVFDAVAEDITVYAVFETIVASGTFTSGAKWKLGADGVFTVYGNGEMDSYSSAAVRPWHGNRADIQSLVVESGITRIRNYAFYGCTALTSITLPDTLTSIGQYAFRSCNLLKSIVIPNGVTSIGNNAFSSCAALENIVLPNELTSIGDSSFNGCTALTSITLPDTLTSISGSVFHSCNRLKSIVIPNGVTSIGNTCFYGCTALKSIALPDTLTSIGDNAFHVCKALPSIVIPSSVTSLGKNAFLGCSSMLFSVFFEDTTDWYVTTTKDATSGTALSPSDLADAITAATYLHTTYKAEYWYKT